MLSKRILSSITTIALCVSFMLPANTFAAASFTGGSNVSGGLNVQVSITDLQVTGAAPGDTVPVFLYVPAGSLSMTTTTGLTFTGASSGQRLYFSGSLTNVNAALATLKYTHSSAGTFTLEASIIQAGQIYDPSTQHIYEVVNNGAAITATNARTAALARSINGVSGYLANITSSEENSFVAARISQDGWFGASDAVTEGTWQWRDGPEAGTTFWTGTAGGVASGYENWASGEPNQSGDEDCSQFYANGSGWNDLSCSATSISTYIVEYGAPGSLPTVAGDTLDITLSADSTTEAPTLTSPASSSVQNTLQLTYTLPEVPTSGSVTVSFNNGAATILTMGDSQSVNTTVNLSNLTATTGVTSANAASLADGTYTVSLNYQDYLGNPVSSDTKTLVTIDTTPPVQSAITVTPDKTTATITLTTNEPATATINYGLTSSYGSSATISGSTTTSHSGSISGLSNCGATYHYQISTIDALGNPASTSTDATFVTHCGNTRTSGYSPSLPLPEKEEPKKPDTSIKKEPETPKKEESVQKPETKNITLNSAPSAVEDSCHAEPYLTRSIKLGAHNDPEDVKLLEQFLNRYENANLPVDGIYSRADFDAVVKWQEKHADDVLKPWGLKKGTGYVYIKSLAKIKEIEESACDEKETQK